MKTGGSMKFFTAIGWIPVSITPGYYTFTGYNYYPTGNNYYYTYATAYAIGIICYVYGPGYY